MPVRRKVFRIEESAYHCARDSALAIGHYNKPSPDPALQALRARVTLQTPVSREAMERQQAGAGQGYKLELDLVRSVVAATRAAIAALGGGASGSPEAGRLGRELAAIVADAERSVESILNAADGIDRAAADLSAMTACGRSRQLASDIRCHVGQILEACGFHDLTGQRVSKVQTALDRLDTEFAQLSEVAAGVRPPAPVDAAAPPDADDRLLNGPKLEGDRGHCAQDDVDSLFGRA